MKRIGKKRNLVFVLPLVLLVGIGLWLYTSRGSSNKKIRHIVLISIDTCRSDHLSCYGYPRETTPTIDKLANECVVFTDVVTPVPLTLPAHTSMLTGTIPPHHGKHDNMAEILDESCLTLAELLKTRGYRTGAFVSTFILNSRFGLNRGFDVYDDHLGQKDDSERRADETNRAAFEWLDQQPRDKPLFLFLHYYDPHDAYQPPEPYASTFKDDLYAGEIAYTDHCIGQVIAKLRALGLYDSSLIVITGDHGEMLGEHGEKTHMFFVYQSALKVPLLFKLPGHHASRKINTLVSIIDIVPTVCDLLEIQSPAGIEGMSLAHCLGKKPAPPEDRHVYCESMYATKYEANSLLGLVTDRWKYIQTTRPELYDLMEDPGESNNLIEAQPHRARILKDRLAQILEETVRQGKPGETTSLDEESLRHLRSLGYVAGGTVKEDFSFDQSKEDPKDLAAFHDTYRTAAEYVKQGNYEQVRILGGVLIQQRPQFYELYDLMADTALKQEDYAGAVPYAEKSLELKPDRFKVHFNLGVAYSKLDRNDEAAEQFEKVLQLIPQDSPSLRDERISTHNRLGLLRARQNQYELAISQFKKTLQLNPDQPHMLNAFARMLSTCPDERLRNSSSAIELAQRACTLTKSQNPLYLNTLAISYAADNNFEKAIETAKTALAYAQSTGDAELIKREQMQLALLEKASAEFGAR